MSTWEMVRTSSRAVLEGQSSAPESAGSGDADHDEQIPSTPTAAGDDDGGGLTRQLSRGVMAGAADLPNPLAMLANPATFLCEICYCNVKQGETVRSCAAGHRWCRDCLGAHVRTQVQSRNLKVGCPHISGDQRCGNVLSEETVVGLLDDEMKARHVARRPTALNMVGPNCPYR